MKRRTDLDQARDELARAEKKRDEVKDQRPLVDDEVRSLSWLLQENNLAARFRAAFTWGK